MIKHHATQKILIERGELLKGQSFQRFFAEVVKGRPRRWSQFYPLTQFWYLHSSSVMRYRSFAGYRDESRSIDREASFSLFLFPSFYITYIFQPMVCPTPLCVRILVLWVLSTTVKSYSLNLFWMSNLALYIAEREGKLVSLICKTLFIVSFHLK